MIRENGKDPLEMLAVQDQQPVETFGANGPHKSLRHAIRLRRAKRRANDLKPTASKHLVKTGGELLVPVADQEAEGLGVFCQRPRQLPGLLCHPRRARIRRAARDVHTAAAQLDEEEHIQPL
jgi:hypothetical protein